MEGRKRRDETNGARERIRNRRAGSRRERERVARRAVDAQPIALAGQPVWHSSAIAFGLVSDYSTLRDRHGVGSDQEPCAKQSKAERRDALGKKMSLHHARDAHLQIEHPIQASLASPGTTPQNAADMYLTKIMQAHYRCHDRVDG